jgi:hypothetical protein
MVVLSLDILELDSIVFHDETPTKNSWGKKAIERIVLAIRIDGDIWRPIEHGTNLFEYFYYRY